MYITRDNEGFDLAVLRQGDILTGVPFPLLDQKQMQIYGTINNTESFISSPNLTTKLLEHRNDKEWTLATMIVRFGFCAVVSNCCDLEPHGGKIPGHALLLARMQSIPIDMRTNTESFESLKANKDPRDRTDPGYLDFFYLESHEQLLNQDWRVHFNQIVCLPTNDLPLLLSKKILQLDDRTRAKFKIKLGTKFMRPNPDEQVASLEEPWQDTTPPSQT